MRTRFWISIAAVAAIAVGSVIAAIAIYQNDKSDFERVQSDDAARAAHQAEAVAALSIGKLSTAAAIVQTQGQVDRHEFRVIGHSLLEKGALDGAGYVPRVPAAQRAAFESAVGVEIRERTVGPFLKRAGARPVYYPLTFGTSENGQPQRVRGFDLGSDPLRARALQRAGDTGMAVATPVLHLLIGGTGINVFRPIYDDEASVKTAAERQQALKGFIVGSFRVDDVAAAASAVLPSDATMQLVVNHRRTFGQSGDLEDPAQVPIHIADRTWLLVLQDPGSPPVGLPIAIAILGIALAALFASLIVSWSRGERMRELERQASQDALTGLGNRRRFEEDLAAAMRAAGFTDVQWRTLTLGIAAIHVGTKSAG